MGLKPCRWDLRAFNNRRKLLIVVYNKTIYLHSLKIGRLGEEIEFKTGILLLKNHFIFTSIIELLTLMHDASKVALVNDNGEFTD